MARWDKVRLSLTYRAQPYLWLAGNAIGFYHHCPICTAESVPRRAYGRLFRECRSCGFIWSHDYPEHAANEGGGLEGSWGGPERGGERDDFMVRFLNETVVRRRVLIYGAGTTLAFRV